MYRKNQPPDHEKKSSQNVELNVGYTESPIELTNNIYEHSPTLIVQCPVCGRNNEPAATFTCQRCRRDHLCISHQERVSYLCRECHSQVAPTIPKGVSAGSSAHECVEPLTGITMRFVPGGQFDMGNVTGMPGKNNELPVHPVRLDGFWMGKYPVTQGEYCRLSGKKNNPSWFRKGDIYPLERISWKGAMRFIRELADKTGLPFRLPTEAEWEYAARSGGRQELYAGGNDADRVAWYNAEPHSGGGHLSTRPVGQKAPNGLGLYDMSGNVWEWCADYYDPDYYAAGPIGNPKGPDRGELRVIRGGSWFDDCPCLRTSCRLGLKPGAIYNFLGFRIALSNKA